MKYLPPITKLGILLASLRALFAYLDPGSGSLIIQLIVAAIVGILATYRFWKARFLSLFGIKPQSGEEIETDPDDIN